MNDIVEIVDNSEIANQIPQNYQINFVHNSINPANQVQNIINANNNINNEPAFQPLNNMIIQQMWNEMHQQSADIQGDINFMWNENPLFGVQDNNLNNNNNINNNVLNAPIQQSNLRN